MTLDPPLALKVPQAVDQSVNQVSDPIHDLICDCHPDVQLFTEDFLAQIEEEHQNDNLADCRPQQEHHLPDRYDE